MSDQTQKPMGDNQPSDTQKNDNWQEVGRQFQELGVSLADAVRAAWGHEETQRRLQEMRNGLESIAREVGKAIDDTANSSQGQRVRQNAEKAAGSLRSATEQTVQEVRPQLITALEELNKELQKLVNRMSQHPATPSEPGSPKDQES